MARRGAKLGTSVLDLDVDDSKMDSGFRRGRQKAQNFTDTVGRDMRRGIAQGVGVAGALGIAGAVSSAIEGVTAVVAGSINAAIEWESAFAGVRKTVDASPAEFEELEASIRQMSTEIPIAATELAGLAEAAGALGVAKRDISEFTRITAMIGTTTDVSSDQAATSLGQLSNVLGLTGQDYERFASTLVDLGNNGASTESQILEIAARAGAGSKLIGMAADETLAWASSVADLGIEAEAGGSALQKFFLDTAKAVADGEEKLETYARVAGVSAQAFARAFNEDASGALQTFLAGLGRLTQGEQLRALEELDFNDVRITRTLLGLAGNTDGVTRSLGLATEAWEDNTALAREAGVRYATTASKLQILGNRVNDLAITFGEELTPALADAATTGVDLLEGWVEDLGKGADNIGGGLQLIAGHFGEMGEALNQLAEDTDQSFGEVNTAVTRYMMQTGATLEQAIEAVRAFGAGNTLAMQEAGAAWESYQEQITPQVRAVTDATGAALEAGAEGIGTSAGIAFEPIDKEAQEARAAAVKAMGEMLVGIGSLFENDETLRDSWQALIDRMNDPYTEAERKADIFSQNTIDAIRGGITSGDPDLQADTIALVNNMLGQIALMEPGALEGGEAVPPALREGMDAEMDALVAWIEENVTHEALNAMTLTEAADLGVAGIWSYAQGMKRNRKLAADEAFSVRAAAAAQLNFDASAGGGAVALSWLRGFSAAFWNNYALLSSATSYARNNLGGSLPTEGPLKGGVASGGASIGSGWIRAIVDSIGSGLGALESQVGAVDSALGPMARLLPALPGADGISTYAAGMAGAGALGAAPQTIEYHMHYGGRELTFDTREQMLEELESIARFHDGGNA